MNFLSALIHADVKLFTIETNDAVMASANTDAVCYDKEKSYSTGAIVMM